MKRTKARILSIALLAVMLVSIAASASALHVIGGRLRMRSGPGTEYTHILWIPNGTTVYTRTNSTYGTYYNGFTYINANGYLSGESENWNPNKTGWGMSSYLSN